MRTLLRSASVLACLLGNLSWTIDARAIPISVGPGTGFNTGGVDGGTPTNLDRNVPAPLTPASLYFVTNFNVEVSGADGTRAVAPFLAVGSPSNYTVLWVGPTFTPLANGVHNLTYIAGTEQFTLGSTGTVFGGVNSINGPLVLFSNGGLTDHDTNPGFGPMFVGQTLGSGSFTWSNPGLGRTYSFNITFDTPPVPEPSTLALLGVGMVGLAIRKRRQRFARTAQTSAGTR